MKTKLSIAVLAATLSASAFAAQDSDTIEAVEATTETVTAGVVEPLDGDTQVAEGIDVLVDTALDTSIREVPTVFGGDEVDEGSDPTAGSIEDRNGLTEEGLGGVSISEGVDQLLNIVAEGLMSDRDIIDSKLDDPINAVNKALETALQNPADIAAVVNSVPGVLGTTESATVLLAEDLVTENAGIDVPVLSATQPITQEIASAVSEMVLTGFDEDQEMPGMDQNQEMPGMDQNQEMPGMEEPAPAPVQVTNPGQVDINIQGSVVTLPDGCGLTTNEVTFTFSEIAQTDTTETYTSSTANVVVEGCKDATISMSTTNSQTDKDRTVALAFEAAGSDDGFVNVDEETFSAELVAADANLDPFNVPVSTDESGNLDVELAATVNGDDARENVGSFKAQDDEHIFVFIDGKENASES